MWCILRNASLGAALLASFVVGPNAVAQRLERGAILVATPSLSDSTFTETVILLLDNNEESGSIGLVINRPTNLALRQVFPDSGIDEYAGTIFYGGPVLATRPFLLLRGPLAPSDGLVPILDEVYLSGGFEPIASYDDARRSERNLRIYAGHARWGAGQLAAEVAAGAWAVVRPDAAHVFSETPLALWRELQATTGRQDLVRAD